MKELNYLDITKTGQGHIKVPSATGIHPDFTAGSAEQIISDEYTEDKVPYLLRASGGDGSKREDDTLVGGTVAWNQLASLTGSDWETKNVTFSASGNEITVTSSTSATDIKTLQIKNPVANHVYILMCGMKSDGTTEVACGFWNEAGAVAGDVTPWYTSGTYTDVKLMGKPSATTDRIGIRIHNSYPSGSYGVFKNVVIHDLTQMFGSTIADHIYALEQATTGAGVAWFKALFPASYYPYNAGELMSVSGVSAHKMVGFNAWDEEWEVGAIDITTGANIVTTTTIRSKNYIRCLPSTNYYKQGSSNILPLFYDANKNYIGYGSSWSVKLFTTPADCCYMKFYTYTDYGTTYKNDICINLSSSRNGEYEPYKAISYPLDDSLTLRGIPKLDASNNLYYDGDTYQSDGTVTRKYQQRAYQGGDEALTDAITDGTNTVVKLVTPTTETADPYTNPQTVDPDGTEEYVTTSIVPVGHDTKYYADLVERLAAIPEPPTANGTYRLIATVSGGVATLSWTNN